LKVLEIELFAFAHVDDYGSPVIFTDIADGGPGKVKNNLPYPVKTAYTG